MMPVFLKLAAANPLSCDVHAVAHLCRLLQDPDPVLSQLPGQWLGSLLDAAAAPEQSVDNIIRRSAGSPFAVTAILLADPPQQTQKVSSHPCCTGQCAAQLAQSAQRTFSRVRRPDRLITGT